MAKKDKKKKEKDQDSSSSSNNSATVESSSSSSSNDVTNIAAATLAMNLANNAAVQQFARMKLYLLELPDMQQRSIADQDQIAFSWGQLAWTKAFQTASLTGRVPAGGLHLELPNVQALRAATGVSAPAMGQALAAGSSSFQAPGFSMPDASSSQSGGGGMPSGGGAAQLGAAIKSAGLGGVGNINADNPTQGDFDNFIGAMRANGSSPNDPRMTSIVAAARGAGYNTAAYDSWNSGAAPGQQVTPPPVFTPVGGPPVTPPPATTPPVPLPPGAPDPAQLGLPGLAPGETPTLDYIQTLANLTGSIAGNPTLQAGIATGSVNGTPTLDSQIAGGVLNNGQQTLQAQIAQGLMANGMPTLQAQQLAGRMANGDPTLDAQQLSGYMTNGAPTLGLQTEQNQRAMQLMQLAASLRQDPFRMMRVLGNTPGGLQDVFNAAAGRMQIPGFSGGQPGTAPSLSQFTGDVQSMLPSGYAENNGSYQQPGQVSPPGTMAPPQAYNYEPNSNGTYNAYPPGTTAPPQNAQVSFNAPSSQENINHVLASTPYLPPSQIAPQAYNRMQPAQRNLLFQAYDNVGFNPEDAENTYKSSLPKYATSKPRGRVAVENR